MCGRYSCLQSPAPLSHPTCSLERHMTASAQHGASLAILYCTHHCPRIISTNLADIFITQCSLFHRLRRRSRTFFRSPRIKRLMKIFMNLYPCCSENIHRLYDVSVPADHSVTALHHETLLFIAVTTDYMKVTKVLHLHGESMCQQLLCYGASASRFENSRLSI